jgi:hypothetical protein
MISMKKLIAVLLFAVMLTASAFAVTFETVETAENLAAVSDDGSLAAATVTPGVNYFTGTNAPWSFAEGTLPECLTGNLTAKDGYGYFTGGSGYNTKSFAFKEALPAGKYMVSFDVMKDNHAEQNDATCLAFYDGKNNKFVNEFYEANAWRSVSYVYTPDYEVTVFGLTWFGANLYFDNFSIVPLCFIL